MPALDFENGILPLFRENTAPFGRFPSKSFVVDNIFVPFCETKRVKNIRKNGHDSNTVVPSQSACINLQTYHVTEGRACNVSRKTSSVKFCGGVSVIVTVEVVVALGVFVFPACVWGPCDDGGAVLAWATAEVEV
jgi:hypothetical protein